MPSKLCSRSVVRPRFGEVAERHLFAPGTEQHDIAHRFGQCFERLLDVELVVRRQAGEQLEVELVAPVPAADRTGGERQLRVRDHARRIEELHMPEAVAFRAGAHRVVEREQARFEFLQRIRAHRAGEARAEQVLGAASRFRSRWRGRRHGSAPFRRIRPGAGVHPARTLRRSITTSMLCLRFLSSFGAWSSSTTLPSMRTRAKPCARSSANRSSCSPLRSATTGAGIISRGVFRQGEHVVDHLRHALRGQRLTVLGAMRLPGARIEQAQVVVDLGDGADRRARIVAGGLLLDGNGGREALDQVDIRLFHQLQELPRVGRQRFDVAPLAFGVERVEGQRALARTRQAGDHGQPVARQIEIDVLEVVRACAANADGVHALTSLGCPAARLLHRGRKAKPATISQTLQPLATQDQDPRCVPPAATR